MEIKATSKYDWKTFKEFYHFHAYRRNKFQKVLDITVIITGIIFLFAAICYFTFGEIEAKIVGLFCLVISCYVYIGFARFILPKLLFNRNKALKNCVQSFLISEQEVKVTSVGETVKSEEILLWDGFYKTYETKDFFYLYISSIQTHIIEKDSMTDEDINTLRTHLIKVMGTKHKVVF